MEHEKAIAMRNFLNDAYKTYRTLIDETTRKEIDIAEAKARFTAVEFEKHYNAFVTELNSNILEYKNYIIIREYINVIFDKLNAYKINDHNDYNKILVTGFEISFLIRLNNLHSEYTGKIVDFKDKIVYKENHYSKLFKHFKNVIESNPNSSLLPEYDYGFNFENLICNSVDVERIQEYIKRINDRLFLLKQWQIENDTKIVTEDGVRYKYSDEYYPHFEELCNLELDRLHKRLELENLFEESYQLPKVQVNSEDAKPPYRWNSGDTDILELITALFHSNAIKRRDNRKITRKELMSYFQDIFDVELKHAESKLSRTSDRKKSLTPYLDKLKNAFENYVEEKEDKQRERR